MASFTKTGIKVGEIFTIDGGAAVPAAADFLTLNGIKTSISNWIRCGVMRPVSTTGNVTTYHKMTNTSIVGSQPGG